MSHAQLTFIAVSLLLTLVGCTATPLATKDDPQQHMLTLLMPSKIEIVAPFTRVKSFDDDATPDGIELLLQAVNSLDGPGMLVGRVHVDLLEYVPASGDTGGRRVDYWDVDLSTIEEQRKYWNRATQMYEFRLQVNPSVVPAKDRFVLQVTYTSPLGEHLTDQCIIDSRTARRTWRPAPPRKPPGIPTD